MQYLLIGLLVLFVGLVTYSRTPQGKGKLAEIVTSVVLGKNKQGEHVKINNVLFKAEKRSAQIDHIVINSDGLFVIETKNYGGRIYGSEYDKQWTQVMAYGKKKYHFYNPIQQNATHIHKLQEVLSPESKDIPIHSIIIFTGRANIDNVKVNNTVVTLLGSVNESIRTISSPTKITPSEIDALGKEILRIKNHKDVTIRQHVSGIKEKQKGLENNICPRCGGKLVKKHSKYGEYLGCENYPDCKFTKSI